MWQTLVTWANGLLTRYKMGFQLDLLILPRKLSVGCGAKFEAQVQRLDKGMRELEVFLWSSQYLHFTIKSVNSVRSIQVYLCSLFISRRVRVSLPRLTPLSCLIMNVSLLPQLKILSTLCFPSLNQLQTAYYHCAFLFGIPSNTLSAFIRPEIYSLKSHLYQAREVPVAIYTSRVQS